MSSSITTVRCDGGLSDASSWPALRPLLQNKSYLDYRYGVPDAPTAKNRSQTKQRIRVDRIVTSTEIVRDISTISLLAKQAILSRIHLSRVVDFWLDKLCKQVASSAILKLPDQYRPFLDWLPVLIRPLARYWSMTGSVRRENGFIHSIDWDGTWREAISLWLQQRDPTL
jgi:hypothetical protein